jgi:hypothetical protein
MTKGAFGLLAILFMLYPIISSLHGSVKQYSR